MTDSGCPICRHPLASHGPSCAEAGCACIYDPKGKHVLSESRRPLAFGSFDAVPAAERQRVTTRAPSYFKPKRGRKVLIALLLLLGLCLALWASGLLRVLP
jgi:hypothetical protein